MRCYAVLDTNVIVSALLKNGSVPWQVAEEALHGDIIPVVNEEILAEYEDVLLRPKFKFSKRTVSVFLNDDLCGYPEGNARHHPGGGEIR